MTDSLCSAPVPARDEGTPSPTAVDYDVVIVGGGIVGATLACSLSRAGLRLLIVEAQSHTQALARQRAYALSLLSGEIFAGLGIWEDLQPEIATFKQIALSDADYPQTVQFAPQELGRSALGYVGEHHVICRHLYAQLDRAKTVTWACPATVQTVDYQARAAVVTLQDAEATRTVRARLVVGADGPRSLMRELAQIPTRGWRYWQSCLTFTIRHHHADNTTAYERFWYGGPMGVLPLPGNRCQIVWTAPHAEAEALQNLSAQEFLAHLQTRIGTVLPGVELVSDRLLFPVQLMQSDRYTQHRLALIGDAAHCCHPVGGQGLNLGIRDAAALAEILVAAHRDQEDLGSAPILQRYERWRKPENLLILGFTDILDRVFSSPFLPMIGVRRLGLGLLAIAQPLKVFALRLMTGQLGRKPQLAKNPS